MTSPKDSLKPYDAGTDGQVSQYYKISLDNASLKITIDYIPGEHSVEPASINEYLDELYSDLQQEHDSKAAAVEHLVGTAFRDLSDTIHDPEYLGIRLNVSTGKKKYVDSDLYHLDTVTEVSTTDQTFLAQEGWE